MSLLYSSEHHGLSQSTTKWQGSCQALTSCALTPACDRSSLRKTRMEYQVEIQGSLKFILLLVQLLTLMHQQEPVEMFNLTSLTTYMFCLWASVVKNSQQHPLFPPAFGIRCTVLKM